MTFTAQTASDIERAIKDKEMVGFTRKVHVHNEYAGWVPVEYPYGDLFECRERLFRLEAADQSLVYTVRVNQEFPFVMALALRNLNIKGARAGVTEYDKILVVRDARTPLGVDSLVGVLHLDLESTFEIYGSAHPPVTLPCLQNYLSQLGPPK
jgi:hypothetical protein